MLLAVKENREYPIDENQKNEYKENGFTLYEIDEAGKAKKIEFADTDDSKIEALEALVKEKDVTIESLNSKIEALEKGAAPNPYKGMTVEQLTAIALEKGVDLGNASSENGIIKKLLEAEK